MYTTTSQMQGAIPERIDRLPLSRETWRILFLVGVAWLIESYDIGIIGNILPSLEKQYQLSSLNQGFLAVASTVGIVLAVVPSGWLADRIGRKKILVVGTAWYAVFSLLCGLMPNVPALLVMRIIAGLGMGAVFPIPYVMAAELTPRQSRGAMTGMLDSFLSFGYFLSPLIAFAVIPHLSADIGWRVMFFIGGLPLLFVPALIKWLPESPRWLQTQGRMAEAERIVSGMETAIEQRMGKSLPPPAIELHAGRTGSLSSPAVIFQGVYRKRTFMMWVSFACILFIFYAIQTYTPTVLVKQGYGLDNAFLLTTIIVIASIPGKYFAGYVMERFGRKFTLISFTLIAAISAILFGFANSAGLALFCGCVMSFFGIGVDPAIKIYGAEQYPTNIRQTGISFFECVGRLFGGVLAPFIMSFTLVSVGVQGSYLFVAALAGIGVVAVALFGTETKGEILENSARAS